MARETADRITCNHNLFVLIAFQIVLNICMLIIGGDHRVECLVSSPSILNSTYTRRKPTPHQK